MNIVKTIICVTAIIGMYGVMLLVPVLRHKEKAERIQYIKEWGKVFLVAWAMGILLMYELTNFL